MSNKITTERNQRALLELASQPGNDVCADCKARNPRWASYNLGIFLCVNCASIHRKIGTHVSKVKSLTLDSWSKEQVENMKQKGNIKSNSWYNPNEIRNPLPTNYLESERDSELELYIRSKYEHKRFLDRSAVVVSHLGPSRSSSTLVPRAQSTPVIEHEPPPPPPPPSKTENLMTTPQYRPSTTVPAGASDKKPIQPTRSVSQPLTSPHQQPPPPPQKPSNPVWDDLISLKAPNSIPSLPLQYQSASTPFASPTQAPNPFGHLSANPGYPSSPVHSAGGYSPGGPASGMALPHLTGMGMVNSGSANPFQQMQQGFTTGTPTMFMPGGGGGVSPNPFAQPYPLSTGASSFGGGMGGVSPMQSVTPFPQSSSTPSFQPSPQVQPQQLPAPFQPSPFQSQAQQYFPSQSQVHSPGPMQQQQQAQQFFQPQPQPLQQQQTMVAPPFMGTPSPFGQQQQHQHQAQQAQAQMYAQGGGFGGWPQGGQRWGGM